MVTVLGIIAADSAGPLALLSATYPHGKGFEELEKGAPECRVGSESGGSLWRAQALVLPPVVPSSPCSVSLCLPSLGPRRKLRQAN